MESSRTLKDRYFFSAQNIEKPISRGKYGEILLGKDKKTNKLIVAKRFKLSTPIITIENELQKMGEIKRKMNNDSKSLSKNQGKKISKSNRYHKYIIKLIDNFDNQDDSHHYFILPYYNKGDLEQHLAKKKILIEMEAKYFMKKICKGIYYLHQHEFIHRDLKPGNVLLRKRDQSHPKNQKKHKFKVVVADLGFTKKLEGDQGVAHTVLGSPITMAPEIWNHMQYSFKVDVWAIGIILFRMIAGYYPFRDIDGKDVEIGIYKVPKNLFCSSECINLIERCLQRNPDKRPSMQDVMTHPFFMKENLVPDFELFSFSNDDYEFDINRDNIDSIKNESSNSPLNIAPENNDLEIHNENVMKGTYKN